MMKVVLWILGAILGLALLYLIIPGFFALFVNPKKEYKKDSKLYRFLLHTASGIALWIMRVKVRISGVEKLPKGEKLLFVGNHRSNFDPIITGVVLKEWQITFVSKASNFKIPIFGRFIRKCCFMAIDRENPRNALKTIHKAASLLQKGEVSIGIYPEGTRSKECKLLQFHNGVFKIAQKANAPIVVLAISGTEQIHKNYPLHHTDVYLNVLEVIPADEIKASKTDALGERIREKMMHKLGEECYAETDC